ncbi:hypothetical protein LWI29_023204 [Acer saccharum]|uniref:Ubiquitin-like protease family profile domain-containing protein n=1 Tax=Acer saccharum TaxID=4024 RepID=A0AA39SZJ2_ACESA|nr:hypothetical protein LWI29_023204 [Acer saccharum]
MLCFPFIIHNDTNVRAYCKFKLKGKGGDKGGDRITELLKAVKALPNEMERIVKQEVLQLSQLPDVLKALVQEIGPTRGQTNKEAPLTEVTDQSLHVKEVGTTVAMEVPPTTPKDVAPTVEKDVAPTVEKEVAPTVEKEVAPTPPTATKDVAPTVEKEVAGSVLVSGDMSYNYAVEQDRLIRVRLRSAYCKSPFLDPTRASETKREGQKQKYEAFKKKTKSVRRNVGTEEAVEQSFFFELEEPETNYSTHIDAYMSLLAKRRESDPDNFRHSLVLLSSEFYTKLNVEWKSIIEADKEAETSFDVLGFDCPPDWIEYGCGGRPGWGQPWWLYTQLLIPCCVGEPDGHWILCKVDLLDRHISICDPTGAKKKSNYGERFKQVMPLRQLIPSIMNKCGFYSNRGEVPRGSIFSVGRQLFRNRLTIAVVEYSFASMLRPPL